MADQLLPPEAVPYEELDRLLDSYLREYGVVVEPSLLDEAVGQSGAQASSGAEEAGERRGLRAGAGKLPADTPPASQAGQANQAGELPLAVELDGLGDLAARGRRRVQGARVGPASSEKADSLSPVSVISDGLPVGDASAGSHRAGTSDAEAIDGSITRIVGKYAFPRDGAGAPPPRRGSKPTQPRPASAGTRRGPPSGRRGGQPGSSLSSFSPDTASLVRAYGFSPSVGADAPEAFEPADSEEQRAYEVELAKLRRNVANFVGYPVCGPARRRTGSASDGPSSISDAPRPPSLTPAALSSAGPLRAPAVQSRPPMARPRPQLTNLEAKSLRTENRRLKLLLAVAHQTIRELGQENRRLNQMLAGRASVGRKAVVLETEVESLSRALKNSERLRRRQISQINRILTQEGEV